MKNILIAILFLLVGCQEKSTEQEIAWEFSGFEKNDSLNPILHPTASLSFECPISSKKVAWEERNVLNPSAIVKDNKVYLFYRAQDINGTSRIGMAISLDGLRFKKSPAPVFYPDNDAMKIYEWNYKKTDNEKVVDRTIMLILSNLNFIK